MTRVPRDQGAGALFADDDAAIVAAPGN